MDDSTKIVRLCVTSRVITEWIIGGLFILLCVMPAGMTGILSGTLFMAVSFGIYYILASLKRIEYRQSDNYFTYKPFFGDEQIIYLDEIGSVTTTTKVIRTRRSRVTVHCVRIDYKNPDGFGESSITFERTCLNYGGFEHFLVQNIPEAFYGGVAKCLYR